MIYKSKGFKYISSIILSYILTINLFLFFEIEIPFQEALFLIAMFGSTVLILKASKITEKNLMIGSGIFSALLSISFIAGSKIHLSDAMSFENFKFINLIYWIFLSLFLYIVVINILNFICKNQFILLSKTVERKFRLKVFFLFVIAWLPYLFIYYPGILSPDSYDSINQAIGIMPLSNHHPIMYTLIIKFFMQLGLLFGDASFAVACFSFAQILMMAAIFSSAINWFAKKGLPNYMLIVIILFFAFDPVIARYAITIWKDILFSGIMLLFILFLYDIIESNGKLLIQSKGSIQVIIYCHLISFARNNGFYIVVLVLLIFALYFKAYYKKAIPIFLSIVLIISFIQNPVYHWLGIGKSNFAESVGIPLQQIGYIVQNNGEITQDQKDFISKLIPIEILKQVYVPYISDRIKFDDAFNKRFLEDNKIEFLKIWAEILPNNFMNYIKAYLMQTLGYWHIGTTNWIVLGVDSKFGIHHIDFFEKITTIDFHNKVDTLTKIITNAPIIKNIYSIAFSVWLSFFYCLAMIIKKQKKFILPIIPLLVLWVTMMIAAPAFCEFRYMYSFHLAIPFLLITMFLKNKSIDESSSL